MAVIADNDVLGLASSCLARGRAMVAAAAVCIDKRLGGVAPHLKWDFKWPRLVMATLDIKCHVNSDNFSIARL